MDYVSEPERLRALNLDCRQIIRSLSQTYQTDFNVTNFYFSSYQWKQLTMTNTIDNTVRTFNVILFGLSLGFISAVRSVSSLSFFLI